MIFNLFYVLIYALLVVPIILYINIDFIAPINNLLTSVNQKLLTNQEYIKFNVIQLKVHW